MVPAGGPTDDTINKLGDLLAEGDIVIDGGNSKWTDDIRHSEELAAKKIGFIDCGVSGGIWGLTEGYALMCGGSDTDIARLQPIFDTLKPQGEFGFVHAGAVGAGHFAKMVHNGIEYGMMQAYAEGWELLEATPLVTDVAARSAPGVRARSSGRGCSTCWSGPSTRTSTSTSCAATPTTVARVAGPSRRRSTTPCLCRSSPRRCSRGSPAARTTRRR